MTDRPVLLAVASYRSKAAADSDFRAIQDGAGAGSGDHGHVSLALLEKGADGQLTLDRHFSGHADPAWNGAILAGALSVVAAPIGLMFLVAIVHQPASLGGVGAIAQHFWHHVPKHQLGRMTDLIEAGQAALVLVAAGESCNAVERHLIGASATAVATTHADLGHEYQVGVEEAGAFG
jgi:hypothetical protein